MNQLCDSSSESTRKRSTKILSEILQAVSAKTQTRIAEDLGCSTSTISRLLSDDLPKVCDVLASVGLKLVPISTTVLPRDEAKALMRMSIKYLANEIDEF